MTAADSDATARVLHSYVGSFPDGSQILVQEHVVQRIGARDMVGPPSEFYLTCATRPGSDAVWGPPQRMVLREH